MLSQGKEDSCEQWLAAVLYTRPGLRFKIQACKTWPRPSVRCSRPSLRLRLWKLGLETSWDKDSNLENSKPAREWNPVKFTHVSHFSFQDQLSLMPVSQYSLNYHMDIASRVICYRCSSMCSLKEMRAKITSLSCKAQYWYGITVYLSGLNFSAHAHL